MLTLSKPATHMLYRLNFLLACGALVGIALCLLARYAVYAPLAAMLPESGSYLAGALLLICLMLTVLILAVTEGRLEALRLGRAHTRRPLGIAGQAMIVIGHLVALFAAYRFLRGEDGQWAGVLALVVLLYVGGTAAAFTDMRRSAT